MSHRGAPTTVQVDTEDVRLLLSMGAHVVDCGRGRVYVRGRGCSYLHSVLMGRPPRGREVDHVNGDGLDNRRANLRIVSHRANIQNMRRRRDNKSGRRGVSFHRQTGKWRAYASEWGKQKHLGLYRTAEEAGDVAATYRRENFEGCH